MALLKSNIKNGSIDDIIEKIERIYPLMVILAYINGIYLLIFQLDNLLIDISTDCPISTILTGCIIAIDIFVKAICDSFK